MESVSSGGNPFIGPFEHSRVPHVYLSLWAVMKGVKPLDVGMARTK